MHLATMTTHVNETLQNSVNPTLMSKDTVELKLIALDQLSVSPTPPAAITRKRRGSKDASNDITMSTLEALKTVRFDAWKCDTNEMLILLEEMYRQLGLINALKIQPDSLKQFLAAVHSGYRDNPFHNFRHCFCVTQMMYVFINTCSLEERFFSKAELAALITACICHDLDHPGLTNAYQINAQTELAVRYQGKSPLENHHCAVTFDILSRPECDILKGMTQQQQDIFKNDLALLILATDMTRHAEILNAFKSRFDIDPPPEVDQDLTYLKMILIKACDVSNEIRPPAVAEPWVERLLQEYFVQCSTEKKSGLPFAPFMDPDRVTKTSSQIGFIRLVLMPLFDALSKVLPQVETLAIDNLNNALNYYEDLHKKNSLS